MRNCLKYYSIGLSNFTRFQHSFCSQTQHFTLHNISQFLGKSKDNSFTKVFKYYCAQFVIFKDIPAQFSSCVWVTACGQRPAAEGADTAFYGSQYLSPQFLGKSKDNSFTKVSILKLCLSDSLWTLASSWRGRTLLTRFAKSGDFESQSLREGKFAELQQKTTDLLKVGTLREQICKLESWRLAKVEKEKMIVFIGLGKVQWNSEYIYKMY